MTYPSLSFKGIPIIWDKPTDTYVTCHFCDGIGVEAPSPYGGEDCKACRGTGLLSRPLLQERLHIITTLSLIQSSYLSNPWAAYLHLRSK